MDTNNDTPRRSLVEILAGKTDAVKQQWANTEAAPEFATLPKGEYVAHLHALELHTSKVKGTPGVSLTFRVCEGDYTGRFLWHDCWLTPAAIPGTKRDLGKLGITTLEQLDDLTVEPGRIRCTVKVALRTDDKGSEQNKVRSFAVVGIDEPPAADPFAPADPDSTGPAPAAPAETKNPPTDDQLFDFGWNKAGARAGQ